MATEYGGGLTSEEAALPSWLFDSWWLVDGVGVGVGLLCSCLEFMNRNEMNGVGSHSTSYPEGGSAEPSLSSVLKPELELVRIHRDP